MAPPRILNCSMIDAPSGIFGTGKSRDMLLATQILLLRVEREGADADAGPEGFHLGWIGRRETAQPCPTGSC